MPTAAEFGGLLLFLGTAALLVSAIYVLGLWRDTVRPPRRTMAWALAGGHASHPDDFGWTAQDRSFPRADGGQTPAWTIAGAAPHARRICIVLHGHGRSRWDALRRAEPWVQQCAVVVLPDLRGHGDSAGSTTLGRQEPRDMLLMMSELAAEQPSSSFVLVGHSLGAVVAIHTAAAAQAAGLSVHSVHVHGPYERVATPFRARVVARGLPAIPYVSLVLALMRMVLGRETDTSVAARRLTCPLDVYADATDMISPLDEGARIASAAPAGTLHTTHGVAHQELGVVQTPRVATRLSPAAASSAPPNPGRSS